jgi:3-methyladenine DNA glycosylase AlkD
MRQLEAMGTAQNRKVYGRHGVGQEMFGVSYANLGKLRKAIKIDHDLALELWATGNHDARVLATMIADPERIDANTLEAWSKDLDNYVISDALAHLVAASPHASKKMRRWMRSRREWIGRTGWRVLAHVAMGDEEIDDDVLADDLITIEERIHDSKNRVRDSMNGALIAIGLRSSALEKRAVAAARRIGKVEVDHGETGCKTPDAVAYIKKTKARRKKGT